MKSFVERAWYQGLEEYQAEIDETGLSFDIVDDFGVLVKSKTLHYAGMLVFQHGPDRIVATKFNGGSDLAEHLRKKVFLMDDITKVLGDLLYFFAEFSIGEDLDETTERPSGWDFDEETDSKG